MVEFTDVLEHAKKLLDFDVTKQSFRMRVEVGNVELWWAQFIVDVWGRWEPNPGAAGKSNFGKLHRQTFPSGYGETIELAIADAAKKALAVEA